MSNAPKPATGYEREAAEIDYRLNHHQDEAHEDRRNSYNSAMFYIGLIAFALIGASLLF